MPLPSTIGILPSTPPFICASNSPDSLSQIQPAQPRGSSPRRGLPQVEPTLSLYPTRLLRLSSLDRAPTNQDFPFPLSLCATPSSRARASSSQPFPRGHSLNAAPLSPGLRDASTALVATLHGPRLGLLEASPLPCPGAYICARHQHPLPPAAIMPRASSSRGHAGAARWSESARRSMPSSPPAPGPPAPPPPTASGWHRPAAARRFTCLGGP